MSRPQKILIVDDNEKNLFSFTRLLAEEDREIDCANSGQEALRRLFSETYSLILLDVQMPEMDGFETAQLIRSREKTRDIPIIFITAIFKREEFVSRGFSLGAVDYITKPVDPHFLRHKITAYLRMRRQEEMLEEINATLEQRVAERTHELQESNASLRREIAERERTEADLARLVDELEVKNAELLQAEQALSDLNQALEQRVRERTAELEAAQAELVKQAHQAGMAEIAVSVLHNIGNVLTSVITSSELIRGQIGQSRLESLSMANALLQQNMDRIGAFMEQDPKGRQLIRHFFSLEKILSREQNSILGDIERVIDKTNLIREVVMAQLDYAAVGFQAESLYLHEAVEDALKILEIEIRAHEITVEKHYRPDGPALTLHRAKLIHILVNVLKNAAEAMGEEKRIAISISHDDHSASIEVRDTGEGIAPENLERIFSHGFTTKERGHGFGLHSCANAMAEMKGQIWAESEGHGKGSTFFLRFCRALVGGEQAGRKKEIGVTAAR